MLTFLEMKNQVADRITFDDSEYLIKIGDWINYRYDDILGRHDWPQLYRTSTISLTAGDSTAVLPRDASLIINIHDRTNNVNLTPLNPSAGGRGYTSVIASNGLSTTYWWEGTSMLAQPLAATAITVVSSSASDTTQYVRIWGIDSTGAEQTDSILLTGTSGASTTTTYSRIDRVSKDGNTAGLVTITAGSTTIAKIDPYQYGSTYNQIRVVQPTGTDVTLNITYKIKAQRLVNDQDTPIIDCSQALVIGAYIDALRQQRQHTKAKVLEYNASEPYDPTTYEGKVRSMIQQVDQQAENIPVMWPHVETSSVDRIYGYRT